MLTLLKLIFVTPSPQSGTVQKGSPLLATPVEATRCADGHQRTRGGGRPNGEETCVSHLLDMRRLTVHDARRFPVRIVEAEFGRDDEATADAGEGFTENFLVGERTVSFGGIEEGDAMIDATRGRLPDRIGELAPLGFESFQPMFWQSTRGQDLAELGKRSLDAIGERDITISTIDMVSGSA